MKFQFESVERTIGLKINSFFLLMCNKECLFKKKIIICYYVYKNVQFYYSLKISDI